MHVSPLRLTSDGRNGWGSSLRLGKCRCRSYIGAGVPCPVKAYVGLVALRGMKGAGRAELLLPRGPCPWRWEDLLVEGEREGYVGFPI